MAPSWPSCCPALAEASRTVGSPQIRNRGTIGGNLGTASPAGDALPPLLVDGRRGRARASSRGARTRAARASSSPAPKRNALAPDELIVAVRVAPSAPPQTFMKVGTRNAMVIAVVLARARVDAERGELRAAFGSAGAACRALVTAPARRAPTAFPELVAAAAQPDRRRARHGGLPPPRAPRAHGAARSSGAWREDRAHSQRRAARGRRLGGREPALRAARAARAARLEERLRAGRMRLVLGAARRRRWSAPASCSRRRPTATRSSPSRGSRDGRTAAPRPGGVRRGRRRPVRLLHARPGRGDRRPAASASPSPSDDEIREALSGNLCRCTGYAEDLRRRPARGGRRMSDAPSPSSPSSRRPDRRERRARGRRSRRSTGEFAYASDLHAAGMLWGHTRAQPAPARAHRRDRRLGGGGDAGVHAVLTHEDVPGAQDLRARVRRPAGARDRPRPLLRRAGRARRRRASGAGAPRRRGDRRRLRAARARGRPGARDRAASRSTGPADARPRLPGGSAAERRAAHA